MKSTLCKRRHCGKKVLLPSNYGMHFKCLEFILPVQVEKSGLEEVCKGKDEVLAAKEQEIAAKEKALSDERQRVSSLTDECATQGSELEQLTVSHTNGVVQQDYM